MTLTGKGYYIWQVRRCENGDPDRIAALAHESNLSHVLVKVADGAFPYNIDLDHGYDYVRPLVHKLQARNIAVWGWQYVYGDYPDQEAEIAVSRIRDLGLNGFVVNAEKQYQDPGKGPAASRYMNILRMNLGSMPLALSSYRYPSYHRQFPWVNFLDRCDYNMPQVYWIKSHNNAGEQLKRSVNEFKQMRPFRPIIPTGPTYKEHGWVPYDHEIHDFIQTAKKLNLPAVNFWYWEGCRRDVPQFWNLVRDSVYTTPPQVNTLPERYIEALNKKDLETLVNMYIKSSVLIRIETALQGREAIQGWIASELENYESGKFSLVEQSKSGSVFSFRWEGTRSNGSGVEGRDTLGVKEGKILYHYAFIKEIDHA
ncbi:MAG: nuclear transport factor 2 family protein [Brevefilum sp.]